ncbi:protein-tyrosine phosphatase-like protein [Schizophyllum commune]
MNIPDLPPPFVNVPGIVNFRSVGGFATSHSASRVKPAAFYRSGDISRITDAGKQQLVALGIKRIFDLRKTSEGDSYGTSDPTIPGVEFVHVPVSETEAYDPLGLAMRLQQFNEDEVSGFRKMYKDMLESAGPAYSRIIRDIIDRPNEPCLVHCTAGKDRTGLFCALVEMILGVPDDDIVNDYALTSAGIAPLFPLLFKKFQDIAVYRENWDGLLKMGGSKPETMRATLAMIREDYGGAEEYLRRAGITDEEIEALRKALLVPA